MTLFKLCSIILFYFVARASFAADCETFQGYQQKEKLCWSETNKAWVSEKCLSKNCAATDFLKSQKRSVEMPALQGGRNPAAMYCHHLKNEVFILKDQQNNEQSFCVFKDKSLIDVNAIERHMR